MIWVSFAPSGIRNVILLRPKETFNRVFFLRKVFADFDKKLGRTPPMKRSRDTFLFLVNASPHPAPQGFNCLGIADFLMRDAAWFSHNVTSGYSET
jgi:hypothetical protein